MSHANATLTPTGRLRLAKLVVEKCWTYERAAERFSVSASTARRWAGRYRDEGEARAWSTAPHVHTVAHVSCRGVRSGASWGCG